MREPDNSKYPIDSSAVKQKVGTGDVAFSSSSTARKVIPLFPQTSHAEFQESQDHQDLQEKQINRYTDARARKSKSNSTLKEIASKAATDSLKDFTEGPRYRHFFLFARRVKALDLSEDQLSEIFDLFLTELSHRFIHHEDTGETARKYFGDRDARYLEFRSKLARVHTPEGQSKLEVAYKQALSQPVQLTIPHPNSEMFLLLVSLCYYLTDHQPGHRSFWLGQAAAARLFKVEPEVISEGLQLMQTLDIIKPNLSEKPTTNRATGYYLNPKAFAQ